MTLHFGAAAADITPPVGIAMGGYWGRRSGATHIRDRLMAKALVCGCDAARIALVAVDLVGLDADAVRGIREKIRRATGIEDAAIMVCASHTHAGPLTFPFRGMGRIDCYYLEQVADAVVEAVVAAAADSRPGRLYYARPPVQIGINRREPHLQGTRIGQNPAGPVVPYAHVLRFVAADGTGVTLFNHACHPVVLGHDNLQISGDFAGAAVRHIEEQTGDRALFVNGACGDVNPRITGGSFADVEALGQELGQAVLEGRDAARLWPSQHCAGRTSGWTCRCNPRRRAGALRLRNSNGTCGRVWRGAARRLRRSLNGLWLCANGCGLVRSALGSSPLRCRRWPLANWCSWAWRASFLPAISSTWRPRMGRPSCAALPMAALATCPRPTSTRAAATRST